MSLVKFVGSRLEFNRLKGLNDWSSRPPILAVNDDIIGEPRDSGRIQVFPYLFLIPNSNEAITVDYGEIDFCYVPYDSAFAFDPPSLVGARGLFFRRPKRVRLVKPFYEGDNNKENVGLLSGLLPRGVKLGRATQGIGGSDYFNPNFTFFTQEIYIGENKIRDALAERFAEV